MIGIYKPVKEALRDLHRMVAGFTATYAISVHGRLRNFQQYFSYNVEVSVIFGDNSCTRRKPQTCRKSLTNGIT